MSGEVFHWRGERARLGAWRAGDRIGYLAPYGDRGPMSTECALRCVERLRALGFASVVTSALLEVHTLGLTAAGFGAHHDLHLLHHDMSWRPACRVSSRRGRRSDLDAVVAVDHQCFDDLWALDRHGLKETMGATARVRLRVVDQVDASGPGGPVAYSVTGVTSPHGYLQRLAVHPGASGRGIGRSLVADSLAWMARAGVDRAYVNTQLGNEAALSLYLSSGFTLLPDTLRILSRDL